MVRFIAGEMREWEPGKPPAASDRAASSRLSKSQSLWNGDSIQT